MFNSQFQRQALAALGAIVLSTTTIAAAVGPARAAETAPVAFAEAPQPAVQANG